MFTHIHHDEFSTDTLKRKNVNGTRVYCDTSTDKAYPSVTSVTSLSTAKAIQAWRKRVGEETANKISRQASTRGTRVHTLCEDYLSNKSIEYDMFDHEMWNAFRPVLDGIDNIHALETKLRSDHLQVAGTVDCIAEWNGRLSVIDFKTSKRPKTEDKIANYFMQCSAYAVAFEEMTKIPVPYIVILMAVDDHEPIIFEKKRDEYIDDFIKLREQYRDVKGL